MKSAQEIFQELAEEFRTRTGLSVGGSGDLAVRFYAVAAQISGLFAQAEWVERQCFPQTALGEYLDLHAQIRGIERHQAAKAAGTVRFFAGSGRIEPAEIPAGTVCMTAEGRRYVTTQSGTVSVEETQVELPVEAVEAGAAGNAAPGQIIYLALAPSGITACTNPSAFTAGADRETDEMLRQRIMATYRRLANGANLAFYEQTALEYEGVAAVKVIPRSRGVGTVDVVVAAQGGMPDESLLSALQTHFDSVREIAVDVEVSAPTRLDVDISVWLTVESGYSFSAVSELVRKRLQEWFTGKLLGKGVPQAQLTAMVFSVEGVANCAATIDGGDVDAESVTLPCLGELTITEG